MAQPTPEQVAEAMACPDCNSDVTAVETETTWEVTVAHDPTCIHVVPEIRES